MGHDFHTELIGKKRDLSILIIDDDELVRTTITKILQSSNKNYYITHGECVEDAVELVKKTYWDTILLDISLPYRKGEKPDPENGITALKILLEQIQITTPVIAITGYNDDELSDIVLDMGAYYFLNKPLRPKSLAAIVRNSTRFRLSGYDGLTGLLNRETFEERLKSEFERIKRINMKENTVSENSNYSYLSIIFFDADNFKEINDTFTHLVGDQVLKKISSSFVDENMYRTQNGNNIFFKYIIRPYDLAARFGGDEFCIFLPETTHENALVVSRRIREQLKLIKIHDIVSDRNKPDQDFTLSLSIGISSYPHPNNVDSYQALLDLADNAMYSSKLKRIGEIFGYSDSGEIIKLD